jgi:hypothetical protein
LPLDVRARRAPSCDSAGDNCVDVAHSSQLDSNQDGYGNACDADFNDDGIVGGPDWLMLARTWGATVESPAYAPGLDTDGDGTIGGPELLLLGVSFGRAPGPSALGCAGTSPCPAP